MRNEVGWLVWVLLIVAALMLLGVWFPFTAVALCITFGGVAVLLITRPSAFIAVLRTWRTIKRCWKWLGGEW